jgi:hypothetical protein
VITSPGAAAGAIGAPFSYRIIATNGPTSFGATGLPAGLVFNSASGLIAGVPLSAGVSSISIGASNAGGTGMSNLTITLSDSCIPALTPENRLFANGGGAGNVTITVNNGCSWSASTDSSNWITVNGGSGSGSGAFGYTVGVNLGQARIGIISAGNQSFKVMQGGAIQTFNDVSSAAPYFDYISLLHNYGITAGCSASPPLYCPDVPVTRAQMSVFIVAALDRAMGVPLSFTPVPYFADMPLSSIYFPFVQRIHDEGITAGCSVNPALFCSDSSITQGEMAVFMIVGWMLENNFNSFTYTTTPYFTDVPVNHPFFKFVQKMRDLGFWTGCSPTQYCVNSAVSRSDMSPLVMRSLLGAP